ncbi:GntR family transcriptional regulator [Methylorubrum extorquens]
MVSDLQIDAAPILVEPGLRDLAYKALKSTITELNIYDHPGELRLDERQLSKRLGVSRTPIREALTILEHQGFVRCRPRRGVFVVKKNKGEITDMVYACASLESMAVRLACVQASDAQLGSLRATFGAFYQTSSGHAFDSYFEARWRFCRHIALLAQCEALEGMIDHLLHLRSAHDVIFRKNSKLSYLREAYVAIIAALENRDADRASRLVLER